MSCLRCKMSFLPCPVRESLACKGKMVTPSMRSKAYWYSDLIEGLVHQEVKAHACDTSARTRWHLFRVLILWRAPDLAAQRRHVASEETVFDIRHTFETAPSVTSQDRNWSIEWASAARIVLTQACLVLAPFAGKTEDPLPARPNRGPETAQLASAGARPHHLGF